MNAEACQSALASSLSTVLDEATFVFGETSDDPPPFDGQIIASSMAFSGGATGSLVLSTSEGTARELAAALLGTDPESSSEEEAAAAVQELLNMAAGVFMEEFYGKDLLITLSPPSVVVGAAEGNRPGSVVISMVTDDVQRLDFAMHL